MQSMEGGPAAADMDLRWAKAPLVAIQSLLADPSIDISFPWESADCERPNDLVQASAVLCDNALFTDPILQVVIGLFIPSDRPFRFDTDQSIFGKTICVPNDRDVSTLNANGRNWLSDKRVAVVRRPTLLECVIIVQQREADAFIANDLEGKYLLDRLGLGQLFAMADRPLGTRGVHAIVSRDHAQATAMVTAVNQGLNELKQTEAYAIIVRGHLMPLWNVRSSSP
jgi:ABC-type amino acid transport substrate-binding protein